MFLIAFVQHAVCKFEVKDMIQFDDPPQYGTIKWIGVLPGLDGEYAGIETVSEHDLGFAICTKLLNKNTLGVKKCEANYKQHCKQVRPKTLISVEAKKLLIKNLFNYLNDIQ